MINSIHLVVTSHDDKVVLRSIHDYSHQFKVVQIVVIPRPAGRSGRNRRSSIS